MAEPHGADSDLIGERGQNFGGVGRASARKDKDDLELVEGPDGRKERHHAGYRQNPRKIDMKEFLPGRCSVHFCGFVEMGGDGLKARESVTAKKGVPRQTLTRITEGMAVVMLASQETGALMIPRLRRM